MIFKTLATNTRNLERILDNLKEGIIAHDLNRRIFFFNKEAETITGYDRSDILGKDCHDAFGLPFCGQRCSFCSDDLQLTDTDERTLNVTTRTGEQRRLEMTVTMMKDDQGHPLGVLASFKDITDLIKLQLSAGKLKSFANIIGQDIKMLQLFQQITDVAGYDYPVHISGETGTGKELVATAIHNESPRGGAPFVTINCGALPESLIESELFGHVKGAFSGAVRDKKGRFELAHGGTVFLDEVAELSKHMQVRLLRFLQEGTFERVGGESTVSVSARLISATNRDLKKEVAAGHFRDDLYYRLNVIPIHIPPLKERKNDIPLLVGHFLKEAGERYQKSSLTVSSEALSVLLEYPWPGNVRELQNAIQFAIVKHRGKNILPADLPQEIRDFRLSCTPVKVPQVKLDHDLVAAALKQAGGNKAKAARILDVGRATLYRFLSAHPDIAID
ncbi:MAG: sigma 54-interacting transcriptional regulator [Pseudomonadota bacterium]